MSDKIVFQLPGAPQGIVYRITNVITGASYIGITRQRLARRLRSHRLASKREDTCLSRAIRRYRWDAFDASILTTAPISELPTLEAKLIDEHQTHVRCGGYNMTGGGEGSPDICDETRDRMRAAARARMEAPGAREKIAQSLKGRPFVGRFSYPAGVPFSEERKRATSEAMRGRSVSAEHRAKISATLRAKPPRPKKPKPPKLSRAEINSRISAGLARRRDRLERQGPSSCR